jgi:uncharacterized protein YheU (UPF0270 family)
MDNPISGQGLPQWTVIPHRSLGAEALRGVIEDFVTREGTDYGASEYSLAQKHDAVMRQLEAGDVLIVFDLAAESVTLMTRAELPAGLEPEETT